MLLLLTSIGKVADGTKVQSLTLEYSKLDDAGSSAITGTAITRTLPVQVVYH